MIIERGPAIRYNCNEKRRLEAPWMRTKGSCNFLDVYVSAQSLGTVLTPGRLSRLPNLVLQALHLVFEAQLQLL
jgi:hypothetical protein